MLLPAARYGQGLRWGRAAGRFALVAWLAGAVLAGCAPARAGGRGANLPPGWKRPPVIDTHAHLFYGAQEAIARIAREAGLVKMFNLSGGHPGRGAMRAAVALARSLGGLVVNFYTPDWRGIEDPWWGEREAARLDFAVRELGYRGLKISKALGLSVRDGSGQLVPVDDPRLDPLWERAGELGVPVAIHTGDPKAFFEPLGPDNERWEELMLHPGWSFASPDYPSRAELLAQRDRMVARHPETTFVCVHFANNPEDLDYVEHFLATHPNAYVDVAARLGEIGRHPPERVRALFLRFADRILFGTDIGVSRRHLMLGSSGAIPPTLDDVAPFYLAHYRYFETADTFPNPVLIQGRWAIHGIALPPDVLDKLYHANAEALLETAEVALH